MNRSVVLFLTLMLAAGAASIVAQEPEADFFRAGLKSAQKSDRHFVTGRVLSDSESLPMSGISVQVKTPLETHTVTTNTDGRFELYLEGSPIDVTVASAEFVTLKRRLRGDRDAERLPDLRLTPRGPPTASPYQTERMTVTLAGGLSGTASVTPFGGQGMPALLPAGFSPISGFELSGAGGPGALLWNVTPNFKPPVGATWLLLVQEGLDWRVAATQSAGDAIQTTFSNAADGAYLLALQDPAATAPAPAVGDLLIRESDALVPAAVITHAQTIPARVSVTQEPLTHFYLTLKPGAAPSGSRAVIQLNENHVRADIGPQQRRETLDIYCYDTGLSGNQSLQGRLPVKSRIPVDPRETQSATLHFKPAGAIPLDLNFPRDGRVSVGPVQLDYSDAMPQPQVLDVDNLPEYQLPGLDQGTFLAAFSQTLGAALAAQPVLSLEAEADYAAVIVVRRLGAVEWVYVGSLQHNGQAWVSDPNHTDLALNGQYAVIGLDDPHTHIEGRVLDGGNDVANVLIETTGQPWLGLSGDNGAYRYTIPRQTTTITATHLTNHRNGGRTIEAGPNDTLLTGRDIPLGDPDFHLVSHEPADQSWYVTRLPEIALEFNLPVNTDETAAGAAMTLTSDAGPVTVRAHVDGNRVFVLPNQSLAPDTTYTFSVDASLTNRYGSHLSTPASFSFHTLTSTDEALDLSRFYLSHEGGQLYLNAESDTFPARTSLDAVNLDTATSDSWLAPESGDFKEPLEGSVGDIISVRAKTPDGKEVSHEVSLVKTGATTWRIGSTPFTLRLAQDVDLRVDRVLGGVGREVDIQMTTAEAAEADIAATPSLEGFVPERIHRAFTMTPLNGEPLPHLDARLMSSYEVLPGEHLALIQVTEQEVIDPDTGLPTRVNIPRLGDALIVPTEDNTPGNKVGQYYGAMDLVVSTFDVYIPRRTIIFSSGIGFEFTVINVNSSRTSHPGIPIPPENGTPSWDSRAYRDRVVGLGPVDGPAENITVMLARKGGNLPMGATDPKGELHNYICTCVPSRVYGIDPYTGLIQDAQMVHFGSSYDIFGTHLQNTMVQHLHFKSEFTSDDKPLDLDVKWTVEKLDENGEWKEDSDASRELVGRKQVQTGAGKRLHLSLNMDVNHHFLSSDVHVLGAPFELLKGTFHSAELISAPDVLLEPGLLSLEIRVPKLLPFSDWIKVYSTTPAQSVAGPPTIISTNLKHDFPVGSDILIEASEAVTNWHEGVTLVGEGIGPVEFEILDENDNILWHGDAAHRVRLVLNKTLRYATNYTLTVGDVRDADNERLNQTVMASETKSAQDFRKIFFTQGQPAATDVTQALGDYEVLHTVHNNLMVVMKYIPFQKNSDMKLAVYDVRDALKPKEVSLQGDMFLPFMFSYDHFLAVYTPDMLRGKMQTRQSQPMDDLPLHSVLVSVGQGVEAQPKMRIWFYEVDGWSPLGSFNLFSSGFSVNIDVVGNYMAVNMVDKLSGMGNTIVYDMNFLLYHLIQAEREYKDGAAPDRPSYGNLHRVNSDFEVPGQAPKFLEYRDTIYHLVKKFPHKFTTYPSPPNSRDSAFAVLGQGAYAKPVLLMAGRVFPGIAEFIPDSAADLVPASHDEVSVLDNRLLAKTKWTQGKPIKANVSVLEDLIFPNPIEGPDEPDLLVKDLAVFAGRYEHISYLEIYDIPLNHSQGKFNTYLEPRLVLELPFVLKDIAVDDDGILAVQDETGGLRMLDLQVFLSSYPPGKTPVPVDPTRDFLNQTPISAGIRRMSFSDGRVYVDTRDGGGNYGVELIPLRGTAWRKKGWEWFDMSAWRNEDTDQKPELKLNLSPHIVLYATDKILKADDAEPTFLMEMGSFALETFAGEDVEWSILDADGEPVGEPMKRKKTESRIMHTFSSARLQAYFKKPENQKKLREQGYLAFKVAYKIKADGTPIDKDKLDFIVAYRYDETRYQDPYRNLTGFSDLDGVTDLDGLSSQPYLAQMDHAVGSASANLDLSTGRVFNSDFAFESSVFGVGMADMQVPVAALPMWWDIQEMDVKAPKEEHLHPRLLIEKPGLWCLEGKIKEKGSQVEILNDPMTTFEKHGKWTLDYHHTMKWELTLKREFPDFAQWHKTLTEDMDEKDNPEELMRYPLMRHHPVGDAPAPLHGPLKIAKQEQAPYTNAMTFKSNQEESAFPSEVVELINDNGVTRHVTRVYEINGPGLQVGNIQYSHDGMALKYTYDAEGYLKEVTQNGQRPLTYTWEPVGDLTLGDLVVKRLKRVERGDRFIGYSYRDETALTVTSFSTPYGAQVVTVTHDGDGLPDLVSLSSPGETPGQRLTFSTVEGAHLTTEMSPGPHTLAWSRHVSGTSSVPLVVADSFNDQTFTYDAGKLTLLEHGQLGGKESWTYGGTGAFAELPTSYTDPVENLFTYVNTKEATTTITADGTTTLHFSSSGVPIAQTGLDGFKVGADQSELYAPQGNGYAVKNGRPSAIPFPGMSNTLHTATEYNDLGQPASMAREGVDLTWSNYDNNGRPGRMTLMRGRTQDFDYLYEAGRYVVITSENNRTTRTAYDPRGLMIEQIQTNSDGQIVTDYGYDVLGRLEWVAVDGVKQYEAQYVGTHGQPIKEIFNGRETIDYSLEEKFIPTILSAEYAVDGMTRDLNLSTNSIGQTLTGLIPGRGRASMSHDSYGRLREVATADGVISYNFDGPTQTVTDTFAGIQETLTQQDPAGFGVQYNSVFIGGTFKNGSATIADLTINTTFDALAGGKGLAYHRTTTGGPREVTQHVSSTGVNLGVESEDYSFLAQTGNLDSLGRPTAFSGTESLNLTYDSLDRVASVTDASGLVTSFDYDARDRLTRGVDAFGKTHEIEWRDTDNAVESVVIKDGEQESVPVYQADKTTASGSTGYFGAQYAQTTQALGERYQAGKTTDKGEVHATLETDKDKGLPLNFIGYNQEVVTWSYADKDREVTTTLPNGTQQTVTKDGLGRLLKAVNADSGEYEVTYDEFQRIKTLTTPERAYQMEYDALSHLVTVTGGRDTLTYSGYDAAGRVGSIQVGDRLTQDFTYHANGQIESMTSTPKGGLFTTLLFDELGGLIAIKRQNQPQVNYTANKWGAPKEMNYQGDTTDLLGGDKHVLNLPAGASMTLDQEGRAQDLRRPGLATVTQQRGASGRPTGMAIGGQDVETYTYTNDQLTGININGPPASPAPPYQQGGGEAGGESGGSKAPGAYNDSRSFSYNGQGQVKEIESDLDGKSDFTYFNKSSAPPSGGDDSGSGAGGTGPAVGKVATYTDANGTVYHYTYDRKGDLASIGLDSGPTLHYTFDGGGNLTALDVNGDLGASWSDYSAGLPDTINWLDGGVTLDVAKDDNGRLTGVSGGGYELGLSWTEDEVGDASITSVSRNLPGVTETWTPRYEDYYLSGVTMTRTLNDETLTIDEDYGQMTHGLLTGLNRTVNGQTVLEQAHTLDGDAAQRRISGGTVTSFEGHPGGDLDAQYDGFGNLTQITYHTGVTQTFHYDGERRIRKIDTFRPQGNGAWLVNSETYRYDHRKRRIETRRSSQTVAADGSVGPEVEDTAATVYAWHGSRVIAIGEKTGLNTTWTHAIGHGPLGPTFIKDLADDTNSYYIMTDHLGTPFAYRNVATGEVFYTPHNPWGEPMQTLAGGEPPYRHEDEKPANNGAQAPDSVFAAVPLGLGGHLYDAGTGLVYMHNRYYHPRLGQFLTADFRAPDIYDPTTFTEPYAYGAGNPVLYWDRDGLMTGFGIPNLFEDIVSAIVEFFTEESSASPSLPDPKEPGATWGGYQDFTQQFVNHGLEQSAKKNLMIQMEAGLTLRGASTAAGLQNLVTTGSISNGSPHIQTPESFEDMILLNFIPQETTNQLSSAGYVVGTIYEESHWFNIVLLAELHTSLEVEAGIAAGSSTVGRTARIPLLRINLNPATNPDLIMIEGRVVPQVSRTLPLLGAGSTAPTPSFVNIKSLRDLINRIPRHATRVRWKDLSEIKQGIKWRWEDEHGKWAVRAHEADFSAPNGSNASRGWIYRVEFRENGTGPWKIMDSKGVFHRNNFMKESSPFYNPELINDTHIPLPTGGKR